MPVKYAFAYAIAKSFDAGYSKLDLTVIVRRAILVASTMEENMADYSVAEHFARANEIWIAFAAEQISVAKRDSLLAPLRAALAAIPLPTRD